MSRPTVLLLFGGESSEHEVSISSARNVYAAIDANRYDVRLGYIDKLGQWWLCDDVSEDSSRDGAEAMYPALGKGGFWVGRADNLIKPDVILPILHGANGEDGSVQGLAQLLHIPIVGCGMTASAVSMDKRLSKRLATESGVGVVPYITHHVSDASIKYDSVTAELGQTLFVKPNRAGSSVGVSKASSQAEFETAIEAAHRHDDIVLIETAVSARELEVAVLGDYPNYEVSQIGEIIPEGEFYSYESKYATGSGSRVFIPADDLSQETSALIRLWAGRVYEALDCSGLARVDFFLSSDGQLYFNEINTMPGFTDISMYPKLWQTSGMSYSELIERLIDMRLEPR